MVLIWILFLDVADTVEIKGVSVNMVADSTLDYAALLTGNVGTSD